ncbi:hypothetical protein AAGG74_16610 [Bacillus mexicanus]|uniref:hypothetical protein n=1 Tax=Bacillus mexicanus TaxID=2834415 RepID=UPI003D1EE32D
MNKWNKSESDDGAEVFYKINDPDANGDIKIYFKIEQPEGPAKEFQLYDDELARVYNQLQEMKNKI